MISVYPGDIATLNRALLIIISNAWFSEAMSSGYTLIIDKSMVKSYDMNLRGKIKIIQKLRPVGNVFKNVADVQTKIDV